MAAAVHFRYTKPVASRTGKPRTSYTGPFNFCSGDPAVRDLQEALKTLGYDPGPIDGSFGATTETGVKAFQQRRGITVDGIVGKVTWINIDEADQSEPVLTIGSTGLPVRRAQKRMSLVGYDVGGVDGRYGTQTQAAVKKLQQQHGVAVDGIVGPQTWLLWRTRDRL
jgi:peptidoglycan hydrolase-like protein with peptidoglycan-binding domain